jgi:hypothetical protein
MFKEFHLLTYTHPERSLDSGTDERALLSRGSLVSSRSPRPDHNNPAKARLVPPAAYAIFLEEGNSLPLLFLLLLACDIEADVLNPQNAIKGRRLAA